MGDDDWAGFRVAAMGVEATVVGAASGEVGKTPEDLCGVRIAVRTGESEGTSSEAVGDAGGVKDGVATYRRNCDASVNKFRTNNDASICNAIFSGLHFRDIRETRDGRTHGQMYPRTDGPTYGQNRIWTNPQMDGPTDGRTHGWTNPRTRGQKASYRNAWTHLKIYKTRP